MSRIMKQMVYGGAYLLVLAGIGFFIYGKFVRPAASCTNGRIDTGEEGIDCGGICANTCVPADVRTIDAIGGVRVFKSSPHTLELLARLQNGNADFAARSFHYRFDVMDESGVIVDTVSGDSFIYGGEIKYLTAIKTGIAYVPAGAELTIENPDWVKAADYPRPVFSGVQGQNVDVTTSTITVSGRVTNKDASRFSRVDVTAIFYDSLGLQVGTSETELGSIGPEETTDITLLHPGIPDLAPSRTQIIVTAQRP